MNNTVIKSVFAICFAAGFLFLTNSAQAVDSRDYEVRIYNGFDIIGNFMAFDKGYNGGSSIAAGDLGSDGVPEVVIGSGQGKPPEVKIFQHDGTLVFTFFAYHPSYGQGINVAVCDLYGDGTNEIVTGTQFGGGPHVRVFDANGNDLVDGGWFAYNKFFRGGVNVACGDWDGDGKDEIVTAAGPSGGPHVRIFDGHGTIEAEFFAYEGDYRGGVRVALADVNGGGDDIITVPTYRLVSGPMGQEKFIDVDITKQRLTAFEWGIPVKVFPVSTGLWRFPTPIGKTEVSRKDLWKDYRWSYGENHPDNYDLPNVKFNLNVFPHIYIHYAYWHNNFGYRMSHGCINMKYDDVEWVYNWAEVGTAVETHY